MNLYLLEPEVAGGIGKNTTFSSETFPNGAKQKLKINPTKWCTKCRMTRVNSCYSIDERRSYLWICLRT